MAPSRTTIRRTSLCLAAATAAAALTAAGIAAAPAGNAAPSPAAPCGELFDDFEYASHTDPAFAAHEWTARAESGGPGVPGATWSPANITFPAVGSEKVLQLSAATDGTAANTSHAELLQNRNRFLAGTYATRIKFTDAPTSGADGAHINQTFFTIGPPQRYDYDPLYSELDFSEYLPNGGWGEQGPINYQTSWNGYRLEPWDARNAHSEQRRSFDGWHELVSQVSAGHVKYFIDGVQVGDHTFDDATGTYPVYPRVPMSLRYNLWFIDTATHPGGMSRYHHQVDWVYYVKNEVISPSEASSRAGARRAAGSAHTDTVDANTCADPSGSPSTPPSTSPTTQPTSSPTPSPTTSGPPANCANARAWDWGTVYLGGELVKHNGRLWQARWWTLGSEPGLTAQWAEIGRC